MKKPNSEKDLTALDESELKNEKLRCEIRSLRRSYTTQPTFWFSCVATVIALITVALTARQESDLRTLSRVELENAQIESDKTVNAAEQELEACRLQLANLGKQIDEIENETSMYQYGSGEVAEEKLDEATNNVDARSTELGRIRSNLKALHEAVLKLEGLKNGPGNIPPLNAEAMTSTMKELKEIWVAAWPLTKSTPNSKN